MRRLAPVIALLTLAACDGTSPREGDAGSGADGGRDAASPRLDAAPGDGALPDAGPGVDAGSVADERAWLHADLWSVFWNDRTRCGAERTFLHMCEQRGDDCSLYQRSWDACDPSMIVFGQVGPEQTGEAVCTRARDPDVGGCDAARYDFDRLRFWWYGALWSGNWPFATIKVFEAGATDPRGWAGDGIAAVSNLPGRAQAAMAGISNHGLGGTPACAMLGETSGDAAFTRPFGAFAWIEVPTDRPVTVVAAAGTNFADREFAGCDRGAATHSPWVADAPGATLGCVHVIETRFEPGRHYYFVDGRVTESPVAGPPDALLEAFAWPEVGVDASAPSGCGP